MNFHKLLPTHLLSIGIFSALLPNNRWILHTPIESQPCTVDLPQSALIYSMARLHYFSTFTPKHGLFLQSIILISIQKCFYNLERNKLKSTLHNNLLTNIISLFCFSNIPAESCRWFSLSLRWHHSHFIWWPYLYLVFFFLPKYLTLEWPQSTSFRTFPYLFSFLWWSQF